MKAIVQIPLTQAYASAYHEAGHAVAAWHVGLTPTAISLCPDADYLAYVEHQAPFKKHDDPQYDQQPGDQERAMLTAIVSLAGPIAQKRHRARSYRNGHGMADRLQALELAELFCETEDECRAWVKLCQLRAERTVQLLWPAIQSVASATLENNGYADAELIEKAIKSAMDGIQMLPKDRTCLGEIWGDRSTAA